MFHLDTQQMERFKGAVQRFAEAQGKEVSLVFRNEVRLLMERVIAGSGEGRGVVTPPQTMAQGLRRVKRDIQKAMPAISSVLFKGSHVARWIKRYARQNNRAPIVKMARDGALGSEYRNILFAEDDFAAAHASARDNRGRVTHRVKSTVTINTGERNQYIEIKQRLVGRAKGGWAAALAALGSSTPEWYGRHQAAGDSEQSWKDLNWSLAAFNRSEWSRRNDSQRIVDMAVDSRIPAIESKVARTLAEKKL